MSTIYYTAATLDGYIATVDDSLEWLFALGDPADSSYPEFIAGVGALAMGSATYEWLRRHEAEVVAQAGSPWPYTQPAWVFTRRALPAVPGADIRFARGDVRPVHAALRGAAGEKDIWIVGGGELAGQFLDAGLLDRMVVQVAPVTLGAGKPLLPRRVLPPRLVLAGARPMGAGMVELSYEISRGEST